MNKTITGVLALIALGVASLGAHAQGNWYVGGYYHYVGLEDSRSRIGEEGVPASGFDLGDLFIGFAPGSPGGQDRFDIEYDRDDGFSVVFGYDFDSPIRSELELRHYLIDVNGTDPDVGDVVDENGRSESMSALANFWFDFNRDGIVRPYAGLGVGGTRVRLGKTRDTQWSAQVGLGIGFAITERWVIDLGYRYFETNKPRLRSEDVRFDSEYAGHAALLGVRYNFIRSAAPEPAAAPEPVVKAKKDCPGVPEGTEIPPWAVLGEDGCPIDSDGDGVPDFLDQCPDTPPGVPVMSTGCSIDQSVVLHGVNFEFNRDRLTVSAERMLDRVARSLIESPGFRVELQGHTDSIGNEAYNEALSLRRAESVRDYLISRGVPPRMLVAKGYGESRPIADNATDEGRASNRRVEMVVVDHPPVE